MSKSFAIVCEAPADQEIASVLADRVLCREIDWLDGLLDNYRGWQGFEWKKVYALAKQRNLKAHGHFNGEPGAPDAHIARLVLLMLSRADSPPDAVLLIRDSDGDCSRRKGLEQARKEALKGKPWQFPIVVGLAHTKRECWVLAGFDPRNEEEEERLRDVRNDLGFDPRLQAEKLTASTHGAKLDAKRVLQELIKGDRDREAVCWTECDLEILEKRGQETGLSSFFSEVRERLAPLIGE